MNVKEIRENMTEAALSVESVMRGHPRITLQELSEACNASQPAVEFIIEQMIYMGVAQRGAFERYSLTPEYKNGNF
ncbi:TPA: hypothetical protein L2B17_005180 [Klebsiella oxytoca]|uniref:hypothetical protein n=1 Tax=Enterobacteriaceae TaxID=543 RepID=UPI00190EE20B|nr:MULTISPECIES: hypothetical protein [Enterobacteriaceae]HBN2547812.1 hypothetical protein [Klebsiella oxytoca]HBN2674621.1 hypothetical protein [Klebsiella oxytoca]HBN2800100.1 hypothetical protein [Klebsiella oxytoca]HED2053094.1 hypothetical protein [Klebsiella oxytoca]